MTDKELRKLNRSQLIELLLAESEEIDLLRKQLAETEEKLADKEIQIREAGSIAEASLKLNRIFEDAQAAADQYLANIRMRQEP